MIYKVLQELHERKDAEYYAEMKTGKQEKTETDNIPVYVRRSLDLSLDTNGYPHTEGNRQVI